MMARRANGIFTLLTLLLVISTGTSARDPMPKGWSKVPKCRSRKDVSALAVSIVYAVCNGSLVLAAESVATATASRCSDTIAAAIGVSVAHLQPTDNLDDAVAAAFSSALTLTSSVDGGVAVAQSIALAIASATPSMFSQADMVSPLADAVTRVMEVSGCKAAQKLAGAIVQTFLESGASQLADQFKSELKAYVSAMLADAATNSNPAVGTDSTRPPRKHHSRGGRYRMDRACQKLLGPNLGIGPSPSDWLKKKKRGRGCGRVKSPVFSDSIGSLSLSSAVAVSIAEVGCPENGNATVAAVAIATAYNTDKGAAVDAIAGVLASGVPVTPVVNEVFLSNMAGRDKAIQAFAAAIIAVTPEQQQALLSAVSGALQLVAQQLGCQQAGEDLVLLKSIITDAGMYQILCTTVLLCPGSC